VRGGPNVKERPQLHIAEALASVAQGAELAALPQVANQCSYCKRSVHRGHGPSKDVDTGWSGGGVLRDLSGDVVGMEVPDAGRAEGRT
jgi:hypothetical protein